MIARVYAILFFAVAVFAIRTNALAVTEYCPAQANVLPIVQSSPSPSATYPPSDLYAVSLNAATPRFVSGKLVLHTSEGWFEFPFTSIAIKEQVETWRSHAVDFKTKGFDSDYLFVRFPHSLSILSAFVSQAQTNGETVLGWDKIGSVPCGGRADGALATATSDKRVPLTYVGLASLPPTAVPAGAALLTPTSIGVPGSIDCAKPFAEASVTDAVAPSFPENARGISGPVWVVVKVAINAAGTLDDAWLWASSGIHSVDSAALNAAKISHYRAARSFCKNAPGIFTFIAQFSPY